MIRQVCVTPILESKVNAFLPGGAVEEEIEPQLPPSMSSSPRRRFFSDHNPMSSKSDRLRIRAWRLAKILFFFANMLVSLLFVCSPPLLVVFLDLLLPSALLVAAAGDGTTFSVQSLVSQLRNYGYRTSLIDLPLLSATRSVLLLCFYLCWGGQGRYLGMATVCAFGSAGFVSVKAISMVGGREMVGKRRLLAFGEKEGPAVEVLFLSSLALAAAHVAAAYRSGFLERRRMLVCRIDIEAVKEHQIQAARSKGW